MEASDEISSPAFGESDANPGTTENNVPRLRVDDAGELIAAIPAMLGFVPTRSLVMALLRTDATPEGAQSIRAVMRFDIDVAADPAGVHHLANVVESVCLRENLPSTMLIAVDDRPNASTVAEEVLHRLNQVGIEPSHAWWAAEIATGAEYQDLLTPGRDGRVDDPRASTVAFAHVLEGNQIYGSRDELADLLTPNADLAAQIQPHIGAAAAHYRDNLAKATDTEHTNAFRRGATEWILAQISTANQTPLTAVSLATIVALVRDRMIRDIMFGLSATEHRAPAEALWRQIASATEGPDRAEAASFFGYSAYHYGDTVVAGIAIAAALHADPDHTIANLLDLALRECIRPDQIRRMANTGREIAAELGIDITTTA
ncbi:DUF4192 domain-containing protein [Nocardia salmonicida]|uniref:DUF4192 domain-containing protein n=1 Tax=Nocardia salmonicida TaxID=53431 RepID=UPI002E29E45F|nr:DUF4192 domain-containing protein [Nocardia salmonicida]